MKPLPNPTLDLTIERIIKAPRAAIWKAWTDPRSLEQWFVPEPARCRVVELDLRPGGALRTEISEDDRPFAPHLNACLLAVEPQERLVFTDALTPGWRPAEQPFMTAVITLEDHPDGTRYVAYAMHKSDADRAKHEQLGFFEGWGTVAEQLAQLVEKRSELETTRARAQERA